MNKISHKINQLASNHIPFWFMIDFKAQNAWVLDTEELKGEAIFFDYQGNQNFSASTEAPPQETIFFDKYPMPYTAYQAAFEQVQYHLHRGDSYLLNLSALTPIHTNLSLWQIFLKSQAKYRLFFKDQFTCFSPEIFIQIKNGYIYTNPMKGTIDAQYPDAAAHLLADIKEKAEHNTIVDLLRNDLSQVAKRVRVQRFRYLDRITTFDKDLWQVSSEIRGELPRNYLENLGDLLFKLLPAGSITGAPKPKTLEIIEKVENYARGYYTGITGFFDGQNLDCGVMIRFIEQINGKLYFKSGGGITYMSEPQKEYQEMIEKVYLPFARKVALYV